MNRITHRQNDGHGNGSPRSKSLPALDSTPPLGNRSAGVYPRTSFVGVDPLSSAAPSPQGGGAAFFASYPGPRRLIRGAGFSPALGGGQGRNATDPSDVWLWLVGLTAFLIAASLVAAMLDG